MVSVQVIYRTQFDFFILVFVRHAGGRIGSKGGSRAMSGRIAVNAVSASVATLANSIVVAIALIIANIIAVTIIVIIANIIVIIANIIVVANIF